MQPIFITTGRQAPARVSCIMSGPPPTPSASQQVAFLSTCSARLSEVCIGWSGSSSGHGVFRVGLSATSAFVCGISRWTSHPLAWCLFSSVELALASGADAGIFENVEGLAHTPGEHSRSALQTLQDKLACAGLHSDYLYLCQSSFAPLLRKRTHLGC